MRRRRTERAIWVRKRKSNTSKRERAKCGSNKEITIAVGEEGAIEL